MLNGIDFIEKYDKALLCLHLFFDIIFEDDECVTIFNKIASK